MGAYDAVGMLHLISLFSPSSLTPLIYIAYFLSPWDIGREPRRPVQACPVPAVLFLQEHYLGVPSAHDLSVSCWLWLGPSPLHPGLPMLCVGEVYEQPAVSTGASLVAAAPHSGTGFLLSTYQKAVRGTSLSTGLLIFRVLMRSHIVQYRISHGMDLSTVPAGNRAVACIPPN